MNGLSWVHQKQNLRKGPVQTEYFEDKWSLQGKQFREKKNTDKGTDSNTNDQNASTEPTQKESLATVQNTFLRNKIR